MYALDRPTIAVCPDLDKNMEPQHKSRMPVEARKAHFSCVLLFFLSILARVSEAARNIHTPVFPLTWLGAMWQRVPGGLL